MKDSHPESGEHGSSASSDQRLVYVIPEESSLRIDDDSIDVARIWNIVWRKKWLILAISGIFAIASIVYALTLTHWYRSEMLLAPADEKTMNTGIAGQLGSLAGLAGISIGGGGNAEALAVLRSRDFTRAFVEEQNMLPVLFADKWDAEGNRWLDEDSEKWPNVSDAARYFGSNMRRISESRETGMVTVAVEWTDPDLAASWVDSLIERLNDHMRSRALEQAQENVDYLEAELATTSGFAMQQAVARLLEREHQKLMLARGNMEFAFRVIDSAEVSDTPVRPNRRLMVIVATLFGGVLAVFFVLARHFAQAPATGGDERAST